MAFQGGVHVAEGGIAQVEAFDDLAATLRRHEVAFRLVSTGLIQRRHRDDFLHAMLDGGADRRRGPQDIQDHYKVKFLLVQVVLPGGKANFYAVHHQVRRSSVKAQSSLW